MTMESDLVARIKEVSGVSNLVGTRVYFVTPQSATFPYIKMQVIGSDHAHHATAAAGVCQAVVQIDCIGRKVSDAKSVRDQVRLALQGWSGMQGSTNFRSVLLTDERDLEESDKQGGETGHFTTSMDFKVSYFESVPSFS